MARSGGGNGRKKRKASGSRSAAKKRSASSRTTGAKRSAKRSTALATTRKPAAKKKSSTAKKPTSTRSGASCTYARCIALVKRTEAQRGRSRKSPAELKALASWAQATGREREAREAAAAEARRLESIAEDRRRREREAAFFNFGSRDPRFHDDVGGPFFHEERFDERFMSRDPDPVSASRSAASRAAWERARVGSTPPQKKRGTSRRDPAWFKDTPAVRLPSGKMSPSIRHKRAAVLGHERRGNTAPKNPTFGGYRNLPLFSPVAERGRKAKPSGARDPNRMEYDPNRMMGYDPRFHGFDTDPEFHGGGMGGFQGGHMPPARDPAHKKKRSTTKKRSSAKRPSAPKRLTAGPKRSAKRKTSKTRKKTRARDPRLLAAAPQHRKKTSTRKKSRDPARKTRKTKTTRTTRTTRKTTRSRRSSGGGRRSF